MRSQCRISLWSGAAIGVFATVVVTWLVREGWQALLSVAQEGVEGLAGPGWLLFAVGVILVTIMVGADFHPLISGIPAVWFLLLFGPSLVGVAGTPDWYPDWVSSYVLVAMSPAPYIVTGVLVAATAAPYVRHRLLSSEPAADEVEDARL